MLFIYRPISLNSETANKKFEKVNQFVFDLVDMQSSQYALAIASPLGDLDVSRWNALMTGDRKSSVMKFVAGGV